MSNDKQLTRSTDDRWIAGVCGGLSEYFGIDSTLMRIIFVLVTLIFSFVIGGLIIYAILWILMPEAKNPAAKVLSEDE